MSCQTWPKEAGKLAAIEEKIISDMPLPTPRSVIISPMNMISTVPTVMVSTMISRVGIDWSGTSSRVQPTKKLPERTSVMIVVAWRTPRPIVR